MNDNKHQDSWAEYAALPAPQIQVRRFDDRQKNRFYYWLAYDDNGQMVVKTAIGVTSLLGLVMPSSPYLTKWKLDHDDWEDLLDDSSDFGTIMHVVFGEWLTKKSVNRELLEAGKEIGYTIRWRSRPSR